MFDLNEDQRYALSNALFDVAASGGRSILGLYRGRPRLAIYLPSGPKLIDVTIRATQFDAIMGRVNWAVAQIRDM
ncbi:MAG: hypothetical protein CUN56_00025 [Phototrophicales bacterium]|nr:MAG: hypothetical protein CUN56_00025 [Phototrophicales bacterium]